MTYDGPLIVDPKSSFFQSGAFYTAITRPRQLHQLVFLRGFTLAQIKKKPSKAIVEFESKLAAKDAATAARFPTSVLSS